MGTATRANHYATTNPYTGERVREFETLDGEQVDRAVQAAHEAFGRWRRRPIGETGREVRRLQVGDRVVVPFPIACGRCAQCRRENYSVCEDSNPNAHLAEKLFGHATAGIFGYSQLTGGYAGGQAEYARVPFAEVGPMKIEDDLTGEQVLFLPDIFPTRHLPDGLHGRRVSPSPRRRRSTPSSAPGRWASSRSPARGCWAPSTHRMGLDQAPVGYETFKHKQDGCVKVVLKP